MIKLFFADLKMMLRNRQSLFWSLAFPLMFTVIFGFFFSSGTMGGSGSIGLINNSNSAVSQNFEKALNDSGLFKISKETDTQTVKDLMKKSKIGGAIEIPAGFGDPNGPTQIKIITDPANATVNASIQGFVSQFLTHLDFQLAQIHPVFSINEEKTTDRTLGYFDFVLMGLIGMALMNSSIQGIAITMANYREDKILKRITTTPLPTWKFISAEVLSRMVLNIFQIALVLSVGYFGFHAHIYGNLLILYTFALIGGLLFQCIGFMISALTSSTDAAEGMATAIAIPMMFLAGVFFPIDSLPKWLFGAVQYLPLAPLLRIIRTIGLEAGSPFTDPKNIIIVIGWIAITLAISVWKFRLSDE